MKEPAGNSGFIHAACAHERLQKFQEENPDIKLNLHDFVKLPFPGNDENVEWMWVIIDVPDNEEKQGFGRLDSDPWPGSKLKHGDYIQFDYKHICEIIRGS